MTDTPTFTAFDGHRRIAAGPLERVVTALVDHQPAGQVLILDDATARPIELDLRLGAAHALTDYQTRTAPAESPPARQGRGRPRLGVVAREVTLLPRHWDWLATQPGGASAALRRLVEDARRASEGPDRARARLETAYRAMSALAGDLPNFEEASRALFADNLGTVEDLAQAWPQDVAAYVLLLATRP